ncbi:MAG: hypothetical protein JW932_15490 [Deltaproteobacteria bacterium]|nr:hypothetical protein [Deltaproteobacteria bacterium]
MNTISQNLSLLKDFAGFSMENGKFYAAQYGQITTSQETSKDITILTDEGDKVTISADTQRSSQYATYSGLVRANGVYAAIQGYSMAVDNSSEFSMTVEGDLSERELKDIRKAIKAIDQIMYSALSGDSGNVLSMINKVEDLESISSFEASVESEKTVVMEQAIMMVAEEASEPVEENDGEMTTTAETGEDPLKPATDQIMDIMQNSGVKPARLIKPLNRYLSKLFDRFSNEDHDHPKRLEMGRRMRSEILERIKQWREENESLTSGKEQTEAGALEMKEDITSPQEIQMAETSDENETEPSTEMA